MPPMFIPLTAEISVAPQISAADCALAAARGFTTIVNNRPDDEAAGQPSAAEIGAAATAAGLHYVHIPVDYAGISLPQVEAMAAELAASPGPVLAYCRSGTRSTHLWALARASQGVDPDTLIAAAATGGYDIAPLAPMLRQLATRA
jgi:uncharacterized protein (TIGR01244 family)